MRALSAIALLALACHSLSPEQQRQADVFECRTHALVPLVEPTFDAEQVARETLSGQVDPRDLAAKLGATLGAINSAVEAWNACGPEEPPVVAPPPTGAGFKVL